MRALNAYVAVTKKDGTAVWFGPGDTPPKWAATQITNPDVWEGEDESRSTTKAAPQAPVGDENPGTDEATGGTPAPAPDGGEPAPAPDAPTPVPVKPVGPPLIPAEPVTVALERQAPADDGDNPDGGAEPLKGDAPKGNASTEEWAKYADANGIAYEPEAGRDAIKEAVEKAAAERAAAETPAD